MIPFSSGQPFANSFSAIHQTELSSFEAAGNQQIDSTPSGIKSYTWNYENQRTLAVLPSGVRETMTYSADLRNVRTET